MVSTAKSSRYPLGGRISSNAVAASRAGASGDRPRCRSIRSFGPETSEVHPADAGPRAPVQQAVLVASRARAPLRRSSRSVTNARNRSSSATLSPQLRDPARPALDEDALRIRKASAAPDHQLPERIGLERTFLVGLSSPLGEPRAELVDRLRLVRVQDLAPPFRHEQVVEQRHALGMEREPPRQLQGLANPVRRSQDIGIAPDVMCRRIRSVSNQPCQQRARAPLLNTAAQKVGLLMGHRERRFPGKPLRRLR